MEIDVLFGDIYRRFRRICCPQFNIQEISSHLPYLYPVQNINVIWVGIYVKYRHSQCLPEKVWREILFNMLHATVMHNSKDGT
jgi:hypothetical protein